MSARQECSICINSFKSPKLLPCHHSFCYKCLEDYVSVNLSNGQFHCPLCRTCVDLPKVGVSGFQTNYYIDIESTEKFPCDLCGPMNVACGRCLDCEENLCKTCCSYHEKSKTSKHHKICDLGILDPEMKGKIRRRIFCEEHVEEEIKLVCKTCNVLICLLCKAIHHESHAAKTLADAAAEIKRKLEAELNQCIEKQKHLDVSTEKGKELEAKINNAEQEEMKAAVQQHLKLLTILDQEVVKIKNNIKSVYDKLRKENASFSRDVENRRKILSCAKESAQKLVEQGTYIDMIRKGPDVMQSLSGVKLSTNPTTRLDQKLFAPAEIKSPELIRLFGTMKDSTEKDPLTGKHKTVLVISPLRALMLDQQAIMKTHSIKAQCIIKDMPKESIQDIKDGNVDVILASPEAIMKKEWLQIVHQEPLWSQLCLLAFDEAHCISQCTYWAIQH